MLSINEVYFFVDYYVEWFAVISWFDLVRNNFSFLGPKIWHLLLRNFQSSIEAGPEILHNSLAEWRFVSFPL